MDSQFDMHIDVFKYADDRIQIIKLGMKLR